MKVRLKQRFAPVVARVLASVVVFGGCGDRNPSADLKEAPDSRNNPALFGVQSKRFDSLATDAYLPKERAPWSDDYWPTFRGGISYRWQVMSAGKRFSDFIYPLATQEAIQSLSQANLDVLSPSEKYDLLMGDFNFTLTRSEKGRTSRAVRGPDGDVPHWFGLCHGWAAAAYMVREPGAIATLLAPSGLRLNFFSSDIKALFSKHFSDAKVASNFIGGRCNQRFIKRDPAGRALASECRDINAGTFHLVLEDYIAHRKQSFIVDMDADIQVWNQPVIGYSFSYEFPRALHRDRNYRFAAPGTESLIDVDLTLKYVLETFASRLPHDPYVVERKLRYTLELDRGGFIIGGEWVSRIRPDFIWELNRMPDKQSDGGLNYQVLAQLLSLSRGESLVSYPLAEGQTSITASRY